MTMSAGCSQSLNPTVVAETLTDIEGVSSRYIYTKNTDGSTGYTIIYSISNHTVNPITANKAEVKDSAGKIKQTVSESSLKKTSTKGIVEADKSFNLSIKLTELPRDVKEWTVRWYYTDNSGQLLTIDGKFSDRH
jgi:hypothetical protein